MGKKKQQKLPKIDPAKLIAQNAAMNRVNVSNPFGSQNYVTGADGKQTLQTTLTPQMQALLDQQVGRAQSGAALPEGFNNVLASAMAKVRSRQGGM